MHDVADHVAAHPGDGAEELRRAELANPAALVALAIGATVPGAGGVDHAVEAFRAGEPEVAGSTLLSLAGDHVPALGELEEMVVEADAAGERGDGVAAVARGELEVGKRAGRGGVRQRGGDRRAGHLLLAQLAERDVEGRRERTARVEAVAVGPRDLGAERVERDRCLVARRRRLARAGGERDEEDHAAHRSIEAVARPAPRRPSAADRAGLDHCTLYRYNIQ